MSQSAKPSICRICKENCGILVQETSRGVEIKGNPDHPISRGFLCFRGRRYGEVNRAQERLTQPLLKRGSGWEKISMSDALEVMASQFEKSRKRHGAQSVAFCKGEALKHQEVSDLMRHLAYAFGTPNYLTVGSLCYHALALGFGLTMGGIPVPPIERLKCAVLWGANPAVSMPRRWSELKGAMQKGAKLLVIDPKATQTARRAEVHLRVTPGSDGFLALAFIKHAVENALIEPPVYENGWRALERHVRSLSTAALLRATGISEGAFEKACALLFDHTPGWILAGLGLELQPRGLQTIRAIASLQTLLDPENRPTPLRAGLAPLPGMDRYPERGAPIGREQAPVFTKKESEGQAMLLTRAILENDPYPVRAMLIAGTNPLLTFPASSLYRKAFESLDFCAVFDLFLTPTAQAADLVFPASDFLESLEVHDYGATEEPYLGLVRPVVAEPRGWPAWKLLFELARALGLEAFFPWKDNEAALRERLSACGVSFDALLQSPSATVAYDRSCDSSNSWKTPDGRVHYASAALESEGYLSLPLSDQFRLPLTTDQAFPLWLSTGDRLPFFQHSQFRGSPTHRALAEPILEIHPDTAGASGIRTGDTVLLSTRYGTIDVEVRCDGAVRPDCLSLAHGWAEANANALTDPAILDPITGFPWMRALPARVERKER